ncbi:MAG: hypothetical protein ACLP1E_11135 [Acidimicrobiales bacterium]
MMTIARTRMRNLQPPAMVPRAEIVYNVLEVGPAVPIFVVLDSENEYHGRNKDTKRMTVAIREIRSPIPSRLKSIEVFGPDVPAVAG